jgi:phosphoglycolate phosphatase
MNVRLAGEPVEAVLVDLDGTLVDTLPDLAMAARGMLAELNLPPLEVAQIRNFIGHGVARLVRRTVETATAESADASLLARAEEAFDARYLACSGRAAIVYPGVTQGLEEMRAGGLRLACITNKAMRYARPLLESIGLALHFDAILTPEDVERPKPAPDLCLEACRRLEVVPARTVIVGDSAVDAEAGRAAGCRVLLVPYGYREGRDLREIEADGIVATLSEAARLLCGTGTGLEKS